MTPVPLPTVSENEPTQKTQPKKGDPIEIPIPTESQIERDFTKVALSKLNQEEDDRDD